MKITIRRRTWFIGIIMPVKIYFNGERLTSILGAQEKVVRIPSAEGYLKYSQPLDRSMGIHVKEGDIVAIKETRLNKIANILFLFSVIYLLAMNNHIFRAGAPNFNEFSTIIGLVLIIALLLVSIISLFFNSYRLVIEDKDD